MTHDPQSLLLRMFDAALAAAAPEALLRNVSVVLEPERTWTLAVGKAALGMAKSAHERYGLSRGLIVAPAQSTGAASASFTLIRSAHPLPDEASLEAGRAALAAASELRKDETLLVLISGGASALIEALPPHVALEHLQHLHRHLLISGLPIGAMNAIRRRVSLIKGGRLAAAAWPARTVTLALSDVPGDRLADIGSGPTVGCDDDDREAERLLASAEVTPPATIATWLRDSRSQPLHRGDDKLARASGEIVGSARRSLHAAAECARSAGYDVIELGDAIQGDARALGEAHAELILEAAQRGAATAIISGGETSVRVVNGGRGGRNKMYLAAAALRCAAHPRIWGLAADTDGVDGTEDDAGAWFGPHTLQHAQATGVSAVAALDACESYSFFAATNGLIHTGPTGTNINDFRVLLALAS